MKRLIVFMLVISTLFACVACQPTPEKPPVVSKNDGTLEKEIYEGAPQGWKLAFPETFSLDQSMYDDKVTVKAENAGVECAKTSDFSVYEATFHRFTAEEIQSYIDKCFPDGELFLHNAQLTKDEITRIYVVPAQQILWEMENDEYELFNQQIVDDDDNEKVNMERYKKDMIKNQKKTVKYYQDMANAAPESVERKDVDFSAYDPMTGIDIDIHKPDGATGRLRVSQSGKVLQVSLGDYQIESSQDPRNEDAGVGLYRFFPITEGDPDTEYILSHLSITPEKAEKSASEYMEILGLSDVYNPVFTGIAWAAADFRDVFRPMATEYDESDVEMKSYYAVSFTRDVDGVPIYEGSGAKDVMGSDLPDGAHERHSAGFTTEAVNVYVNDSGVCGFTFKAPLDIKKVQESVKLIDFDEVKERTAEQLAYRHAGIYVNQEEFTEYQLPDSSITVDLDIDINSVVLRYAECAVQDDTSLLRLIPVWVCTYNVHEKKKDGSTDSGFNSSLIYPVFGINAIDGSTYSFGLGY